MIYRWPNPGNSRVVWRRAAHSGVKSRCVADGSIRLEIIRFVALLDIENKFFNASLRKHERLIGYVNAWKIKLTFDDQFVSF